MSPLQTLDVCIHRLVLADAILTGTENAKAQRQIQEVQRLLLTLKASIEPSNPVKSLQNRPITTL